MSLRQGEIVMRLSQAYAAEAQGQPLRAVVVLQELLMAGLSVRQRQVYDRVVEAGQAGLTSREVAEALGITVADASTVLRSLADLGLLADVRELLSEVTPGSGGQQWRYRLVTWREDGGLR